MSDSQTTGGNTRNSSNPLSSITRFRNEDQLHSTGENFVSWKKLQTILFLALDLYDIVSGATPEPAAAHKDYAEWVRRDSRALASTRNQH